MVLEDTKAVVILVASLLLAISLYRRHLRSIARLPPGPRGLPFIGAAFRMPKENEQVTYSEWQAKYGDIVGLQAFGQNIVIINTSELCDELLNRRASIYSNRPRYPMLELSVSSSPFQICVYT